MHNPTNTGAYLVIAKNHADDSERIADGYKTIEAANRQAERLNRQAATLESVYSYHVEQEASY